MPKVEISIKTASGQTIVLSPEDRIERAITTECNSKRCASRHDDKQQEVTVVDGVLPEGNQWLMLVVSEQSPNYLPQGIHLCSPQCCKDFLVYDYIAPASRASLEGKSMVGENPETVQKDGVIGDAVTCQAIDGFPEIVKVAGPTLEAVSQVDGDPGDTHGA